MPYNEDQQLLSDITGSPLGGPGKPSFFGSISSPEWKQYDNYNEMQSQLQRAQLMHALDQKFHPLSLEDASRYTGVPMDQMASPDQRQNVTDISYVPSMVEGPRPMGTRPDFGEKIGERRGEPGDYVTNPDELFPNAMRDTPNLYMGMNQDFLDKKSPYYEPGQLIEQYSTKQVPTELQGPGAPVEGQRMIESSRSQINPAAPADWVQRGLVEASLAQRKLRPPARDKGTPEERKLEMARQYYLDPEGNKAQGVVSGAINTERQVQGTQSQMGLNKSKAENLDAQTQATQELLGTRKANLQAQTSKLKQQISELKDTEGVRKDKLVQAVELSKFMQKFYDARMERQSADLALKAAGLERGTNELYLKEIKAQLALLHEIKPDLEDADVDSIIGSLGEKFGFQSLSRKRNLGQRLSDMFSDTERAAPEAGPVPMPQTGASKGSGQSLQFRQSSQSRVPNQGESQGQTPVQAPDATVPPEKKGLGELGTEIIGKTDEGRPIVKNPDGSVSTERTTTLQIDGKWTNIPTMYGGKEVSDEEAVAIIKKNGMVDPETGRKMPTFDSMQEAEAAARKRSEEDLGKYSIPQRKTITVDTPDAAALLKEVEKSLGDVSKLEGKTIRDKKSGKQFRIQNGKPVPVE